MKKSTMYISAVTIALLVACLVGCGKSQDNSATTDKAAPMRAAALPQKSSDAVEFAIAMYVQRTGQLSGFGNVSAPRLSEAEIKRLNALGEMEFDCKMGGITGSLDGSKNTVGPGGYIDVTLKGGTMKCTIRIGEGSFGIENGKVVIGEGTQLTFDGSPYIRKGGVWVKAK